MANYMLVNADQLNEDLKIIADKIREKTDSEAELQFPSEFISGIEACSSLNFCVVGGTTEPEEFTENTIWVNTDTDMKGWAFSATEPENPVEGMIWIQIGNSSAVAFNALNSNNL